MRASAGFTILELLLSVALIAAVFAFSAPVYQTFQVKTDLDLVANTALQSFRQAQTFAEAALGDSAWGVELHSGTLTVFKGSSYATRDTGFDETFDIPTTISPSGMSEVVFTKFTGAPSVTGTLTLTSSTTETRTITINAKGLAD